MSIHRETEKSKWMHKLDKVIRELQNEKGRLTYDKVVERAGISITALLPSSEVSRYIIAGIKNNKEHTSRKVLTMIEDMISKKQTISMSELSRQAGVSRTLLYEDKEIRKRVQKYEKVDKLKIVQDTIKELYILKQRITIDKLHEKLGMEKSFLSQHIQIRLWINEYNEQIRLDKYIEQVKTAIFHLRERKKKVNISQVAKEMGVYTSYLYRQPQVIEYIKKEKAKKDLKET